MPPVNNRGGNHPSHLPLHMSCDVTGWDGSSLLTRPALGCQVLVKLREDVDAGPGQMFQGPPVTQRGRGIGDVI